MVFCTNCQSEIEDSKMFLHEGFCKKNIKYCFKCKEKIPIEEYEEHLENHNTKKSEQKEETEQKEEKNSIKENVHNPTSKEELNIECQYCSLPLDPHEIEEHEKMCGARTVQCEICGKYIYVRLIKQHMNVIHDMGYKDIYNEGNEEENEKYKKECEKRKQIEDDEILARKLAEEYKNYDMFNSRRYF